MKIQSLFKMNEHLLNIIIIFFIFFFFWYLNEFSQDLTQGHFIVGSHERLMIRA